MAQAINVPVNVQAQNTRQLTQQIQASLNSVRLNLGNGKALSSLSQPLGRLTGQADEFSKSLDAANARVLAFGASVGIVNAFSNAFKNLVASTIEVEKAIKAITVVGDQFNGKTKELTQGLFNVAKTTGQSFAEVSKAALEFSRQGLGVEQTLQRTKDALILTRLTGLDAAKAVEGLTAAANGFTKAGLSTTQILNKLAAVDQAFAVSSADLIEGFNRSAAVAENAGVTFDELAGIITALQQKTSRGGAVIGNALKTIFTRLQDTNTLNQLQGLGIAVQDLQGNLLPARQILQNLAKDVQGLGQITKAGIFKDVAGAFQINQLISLVDDLNNKNSIAADATKKSAGATNEAFLANEKLSQSLDAIINKVGLTGKQLGSLIGELGLSDSFKGILDGINSFLEGATNLLQGDDLGSKFAKGIVKGIGAVLTGPGLGIFLAVIGKLTLDLVKFGTQSIKTFFGIGQAAKQQQQVQESIVQTLLRNENVLRSILNTQGGQNAQAQTFLTILNQQEQALQNIRSLAGGLAAPVIAGGYGLGPQGGLQRTRGAAGGYLPAQEASDVRRGVGGASPSSKVVAIPNFAFGGGKRGTMIANTSEYIVPNYAGGGSAIFNQDMVKTMGLPAGAKKISAAGGFVPNYAKVSEISKYNPRVKINLTKSASTDNRLSPNDIVNLRGNKFNQIIEEKLLNESEAKYENRLIKKLGYLPNNSLKYQGSSAVDGFKVKGNSIDLLEVKSGNWNSLDVLNKFLRALPENYGTSNSLDLWSKNKDVFSVNAFLASPISKNFKTSQAKLFKKGSNGYIPNFAFTNDQLGVLGLYGPNTPINGSQVYTFESNRPQFFKDIKSIYQKRVTGIVNSYARQIAGKIGNGFQISPKAVVKSLDSTDRISGFIFEDVMNQLAGPNFDTNRVSGNVRIDFPMTSNLREVFGVTGVERFAEVKLTPQEQVESILEKQEALARALATGGYTPGETDSKLIEELRKEAIEIEFGKGGRPRIDLKDKKKAFIQKMRSSSLLTQRYAEGANETNAIKKALGLASTGYIPNFAASALQQAIAREKNAGLSSSQIYIDQSPALKSPSNPMGLMVANTRDEPAGGFQGVARARKEGTNPKTYGAANGFVPNYAAANRSLMGAAQRARGQRLAPSASSTSNSQAQSSSDLDEKSEQVASGFGDVAGKVFLAQSALAFFNGAIEDTENSFAKLTAQITTSIGNIASLGLIGSQIASMNPTTAFGGFIKGLGLAGIGAAGIYEGFKLLDFGIKEFSGENAKAALASAKLSEASNKLALQFDNLSKTRQIEITKKSSELLGQAGFQSFFGKLSSNIFGTKKGASGDIGGNTDVQKAVAQLATLGASEKQISKILESAKVIEKQERYISAGTGGATKIVQEFDITQASDVLKKLEEALSSGLGKTLDAQFKSFETALAGIDLTKTGEAAAYTAGAKAYGKEKFSELNPEQKKAIEDRIRQQVELNKQKQEEQKVQANITFGERLTTEIAKKRIDSALEIIKLKMQETTSEEEIIQLRMETLDLSNREKIIEETKLKKLELQKKARLDIIDSVAAAVDKAQGSSISVNAQDLDKLKNTLNSIDFSNLTDANFESLAKEIGGESGAFKIGIENAKNLLNSVKAEKEEREKVRKVTEGQLDTEQARRLKIDDINQSLNNQLSTLQRIAQTAQSIANFNISVGNLDIAKNEAEITRLQALSNDPNLTTSQKEAYDKQVISLQKRNNELKKGNELLNFESKQADILSKQRIAENELARLREKNINPERQRELIDEIERFNIELNTELNNYKNTTIAIDANTQALSIQEQQIGKVAGAYASLAQQLESFRRGAGERIAGAELGILSSTDANSLARSTIQRQVEFQAQGRNLNNQDYYKFVNQETALREKQFELQTETSKVRKIELERELKLMEDISKISAATDEERLTKIKEIIAARQQETQTFGFGFSQGVAELNDKTQNFKNEIGREIPNLFSSNLAQGLNDAISGAKSLKDALRDAATSFLNAITQKNIQNLADLFTGGVGSFFTRKASGGMISGGSGTKDDVPAMLMGGEYVIKKSAVKKYGSKFLDSLNNGGIKAFAAGGGVQSGRGGFYVPGDYGEGAITGKNQLLAFAGQSFTGGQYDQIGVSGMGGASVSLESESARLTAFGRENSPMFERVQQAKEEAFNVYLNQLKQEQQYREQLKQIEEAEKARKKQLTTAIVSAVVSSALSYAGSAFGTGAENAVAEAGAQAGKPLTGLQKFTTGFTGGLKNLGAAILLGGAKPTFELNDYAKANRFMNSVGFNNNFKPDYSGGTFRTGSYEYNPSQKGFGRVGKASGGMVTGGSGIRDDVPAMLTGGEFVLNNRATRKLGVENLNRLNSGDVGGNSGASGQQVSESIISKLDELIQTTRESSKDNVVVNVSGMEASEKRADENKSANDRELQRKIRDAVLAVLAQEKRMGGSLSK